MLGMSSTAQPQSHRRSVASLFTLQSHQIDEWWPHVAGHIQRWVDVDETWTANGIREELKAARAQLWCLVADGAVVVSCVTRIEETDSVRFGLVWGCAGDFMAHKEDAIAFFGTIEDWFREKGCKFVDWSGREGWAKMFPDYKRHAVTLRKRL
jgi:hypothetical protein